MKDSWRKSEKLVQSLMNFMPGMLAYWTHERVCTFANRAYLDWLGMTLRDIKGVSMQDLLGDAFFHKEAPFAGAAWATEIQEFERTLTRPNGESGEALIHYIPHLQGDTVLGFFLLMQDITEHSRLEQALIFATEKRQQSIGHELHDNLGQQMAALAYQAKALEKKLVSSQHQDAAKLAASMALQAQTAVIHCKQIAQDALPFELEANGLVAALQAFAARISSTYDIHCHFESTNTDYLDGTNFALNLYRMAQEATHNAIRHGGAKNVVICLSLVRGELSLCIDDDGCGFSGVKSGAQEAAGRATGMGLKIMQYRARQLGASLKIMPGADKGVQVRISMRTEELKLN